jgi:hypothetical protein
MVMLLQDSDGSEFELGLIEDRLPEVQDGFGDASTLTLSFRVATPDESWEETSPCMNTFEIENLADWLEAVADADTGRAEHGEVAELDLLEPELNFAVIRDLGSEVVLRVGFHLENRPEEFGVDAPTDEAPYVDLRITRDHLRIAAAQLRGELQDLGREDTGGMSGAGGGEEQGLLRDDLLGEAELGEVRPPEEDLGLRPRPVSEEDVGFGRGLDEGEQALFDQIEEEREDRDRE